MVVIILSPFFFHSGTTPILRAMAPHLFEYEFQSVVGNSCCPVSKLFDTAFSYVATPLMIAGAPNCSWTTSLMKDWLSFVTWSSCIWKNTMEKTSTLVSYQSTIVQSRYTHHFRFFHKPNGILEFWLIGITITIPGWYDHRSDTVNLQKKINISDNWLIGYT